jgi:hypothetical protein
MFKLLGAGVEDIGNDDETKPSFTPTFIHLGSVHRPIVASRAQL